MQTKHWAVVGALIVAVGMQLVSLEHGFADAFTPGFIGGLLIQIGTTVAALMVGSPLPPRPWDQVERRGVRPA